MNFRVWFLVAVLLVPVGPLGAQEEFPIGAWFPGMTEGDDAQWAARLDSVRAAGFNTVHAIRGRGGIRTSEYNKKWMDLAHVRGLKVQLHSWQQPEDWREHSRNYWTRTFEAEDMGLFTYAIGKQVTDDGRTRRVARYAATDEHNPGLLLDSGSNAPSRLYLRRNPESGHYSRFGHHVFRLKTDDATGTDHIATLRVLQPSGTVMDSMEVFEDDFQAADTYQDFGLEYDIGPGPGLPVPVRYQVYWTGADTLWVDHIRAHDWEIDPDTEEPVKPPHAARLFAGKFDGTLTDTLAKYDGVRAPRPWRFALYDEPRWELRESVAYVDSFIEAQTGGTPGISPYNVPESLGAMERYVDTVDPPELLVDFYPFFQNTPAPGQAAYADSLRRRLDWLVTGYGHARAVSLGLREDGSVKRRIPLWCVVQTHNWSNLRNPTPEEIRVQVNLALAHGARGIYYYQYHSYIERNEDGTERRRVNGLMDHDFRRTPRLDAVEALNTMLDALDDTFLELTSDDVFAGDDPDDFPDFVQSLSVGADYFLGAFTHTDDTRYLMVVNTQCGTAGMRTTTVTLNAAALSGTEYDYRVFDPYGRVRAATTRSSDNPDHRSFSVSLEPGEGKLYRIERDQPGTVSLSTTTPSVGALVTATLEDPDVPVTNELWTWQRRVPGSSTVEPARAPLQSLDDLFKPIFTPSVLDVDRELRASVSYRDVLSSNEGLVPSLDKSAQSVWTEPVSHGPTYLQVVTETESGGLQFVMSTCPLPLREPGPVCPPPTGGVLFTVDHVVLERCTGPSSDEMCLEFTGADLVELVTGGIPSGVPGERSSQARSRVSSSLTFSAPVAAVDNRLDNRKTYRFTAYLVGPEEQRSPESNEVTVLGLRAEARAGAVGLSWDVPAGLAGITGWAYRYKQEGGTWDADSWQPAGTGATATTVEVGSLTNGVSYEFQVRALLGAETGPESFVVSATPARPDTRGRVEWSTTQPRVGQELTPTLIDPDAPALAEARWRWRRLGWLRSDAGDSLSAPAPESRSGESKLGVIARTRQYRPQVSDLNQWLWVEVTYTDDFGRHRVSATASRAVGPGPPCAPAQLTNLRSLSVRANRLSGLIPAELAQLANLEVPRCQTRDCGLPRIPIRGLISPGYFDYPGDTPTSWNDIYFGEGDNDGNIHMGRNFENTAYVHMK